VTPSLSEDWEKDPSNRRSAHWHDAYLNECSRVAGLEAERDEAVENCRGFERRAHTAEAENTRLRNEVIYLKELNNGLNYSCDGAEARLAVLQNRLAAARGFCDEFCAMQCEEGPEWGECEECGCALFKIKAALGEEKKK